MLVSRMERFDAMNGRSSDRDRWGDSRLPPGMSFLDWVRRIFHEPDGHFRLFVIVVSRQPITADTNRHASFESARQWFGRTIADKLPLGLGDDPLEGMNSAALVYHFVKRSGSDPLMKDPSELRGKDHLVGAGMGRLAP